MTPMIDPSDFGPNVTAEDLRDPGEHPDLMAALDRSRPLSARRESYARWRADLVRHYHPGVGHHAHPGGNDPWHRH